MMETKTLRIIQNLSKVGRVVSKVIAILCIIGAVGCLIGIFSIPAFGYVAFQLGGLHIDGLIERSAEMSLGTLYAKMMTGLILCIGEAVLAKLAEKYFRNELAAGTPFTFEGARELLRLGICSIAITAGTVTTVSIVCAILHHYFDTVGVADLSSAIPIGTGIAMMLVSLLLKYGAEREAVIGAAGCSCETGNGSAA